MKAENSYQVYETVNRIEMIPFVPENAQRILDVGCGVGNFGEALKSERKVQVWGAEINERAAEIASKKLDTVLSGGFDKNLKLPVNYFDCIVFNDVLEHMVDPYEALNLAKKLLKKDGKVIASIPNVRYFGNMWLLLVHKNWEYVDAGILDRTHLRFFTKKSIKSTFENLNFEIEQLIGINPLEKCDPYFVRKFRFLNSVTFNNIEDMRWLQFAIVAHPKD